MLAIQRENGENRSGFDPAYILISRRTESYLFIKKLLFMLLNKTICCFQTVDVLDNEKKNVSLILFTVMTLPKQKCLQIQSINNNNSTNNLNQIINHDKIIQMILILLVK